MNSACTCIACRIVLHKSDCSVHNEPAKPNGPCDCGAVQLLPIDRIAARLADAMEAIIHGPPETIDATFRSGRVALAEYDNAIAHSWFQEQKPIPNGLEGEGR